jgi:hypothetical protein
LEHMIMCLCIDKIEHRASTATYSTYLRGGPV